MVCVCVCVGEGGVGYLSLLATWLCAVLKGYFWSKMRNY